MPLKYRITNSHNLPPQVVAAVLRDEYDPGDSDITATQLILPPRMRQLRLRHAEEIELDVMEMTHALLGKAIHKILEYAPDMEAFHEERVEAEILGWKVSGAADVYTAAYMDYLQDPPKLIKLAPAIQDYKVIKVSAAKFEHDDWEKQLNVDAFLWRNAGFEVKQAQIVAWFKDWSKIQWLNVPGYPPSVAVYPQNLWSFEEQGRYVTEMVRLHQAATLLPDDELPFCTPGDQWRKQTRYEVKPGNRKRGKRFNSMDEATSYAATFDTEPQIIVHQSEPVRCRYYCEARDFCNQYRIENTREEEADERVHLPGRREDAAALETPFG